MIENVIRKRGAIDLLASILTEMKSSKVFLVTGRSSYEHSIQKSSVDKHLSGFKVFRHCDFDINPKIEDIMSGVKLAQEFSPDVIVGIGGGSVMDTAKLISVFINSQNNIKDTVINNLPIPIRDTKLVLIPTTAGSGSEATHFAVLYIGKEKYSVASTQLLPDKVILDSALTDNIPKYLTAVTSFDALSQAIESFWSVGSTDESKKYSIESIKLILENFDDLVTNPTPIARENILYASYLAGKAINISKTTAPHAISYSLTNEYGIPHGHAVALTLGSFMDYNFNSSPELYLGKGEFEIYKKHFRELLNVLKVNDTNEAKMKLTSMMIRGEMAINLRGIGMENEDEIDFICDSVNAERLKNNPFEVSRYNLYNLLRNIY